MVICKNVGKTWKKIKSFYHHQSLRFDTWFIFKVFEKKNLWSLNVLETNKTIDDKGIIIWTKLLIIESLDLQTIYFTSYIKLDLCMLTHLDFFVVKDDKILQEREWNAPINRLSFLNESRQKCEKLSCSKQGQVIEKLITNSWSSVDRTKKEGLQSIEIFRIIHLKYRLIVELFCPYCSNNQFDLFFNFQELFHSDKQNQQFHSDRIRIRHRTGLTLLTITSNNR